MLPLIHGVITFFSFFLFILYIWKFTLTMSVTSDNQGLRVQKVHLDCKCSIERPKVEKRLNQLSCLL